MRQQELYLKTLRSVPKDETSTSAQLLIRGGFINKEMAGVYSYLPLGLRVINKISDLIRQEMEKLGGREILMSALQPKENWLKTGRWKTFDVLYRASGKYGQAVALGSTHEEIITPLAKKIIFSYRDLPVYLYQIQTKFRNEPRAKSGILRGREFIMKDLYSFHANEKDLENFHQKISKSYLRLFRRIGLQAVLTLASGGTFSPYSFEFQVLAEAGEDVIFYCPKGHLAENREIAKIKEGSPCPRCRTKIKSGRAIEVGNIFNLGTRFSQAFNLTYKAKSGEEKLVWMGSYGIGISRLMGTIVEVNHDEKGIIWPESVAPFRAHLLELEKGLGENLYRKLTAAGIEVLYDNRDLTPGEKFNDADLLGIPWRLVVSPKTKSRVEIKRRDSSSVRLLNYAQIIQKLL